MPSREWKAIQVLDQRPVLVMDYSTFFLVRDTEYAFWASLLHNLPHRNLAFAPNNHVYLRIGEHQVWDTCWVISADHYGNSPLLRDLR